MLSLGLKPPLMEPPVLHQSILMTVMCQRNDGKETNDYGLIDHDRYNIVLLVAFGVANFLASADAFAICTCK